MPVLLSRMPIIKEEPLNKYDPSSFSFAKVKGEVSNAVLEDWKHDKVDNAKKRAIYDCKNYDEFKQRVAGCTLKPIHRNEFNAPPKFAFNRQVLDHKRADGPGEIRSGAELAATAGVGLHLPSAQRGAVRNGREFERELRRCTSQQERVALLQGLDGKETARLFRHELDAEVLRQLLVALDEINTAAATGTGRRFLAALAAHCPASTATAASFLTAAEKEIVARLLIREAELQPEDQGDDVRICAALGVPPGMVAAMAAAAKSTACAETVQAEPKSDCSLGSGACNTLD